MVFWLTLQQAAEVLGLSISTLRLWVRRGRCPARKVGVRWRVSSAWVEQELAKRGGGDDRDA